MRDDTITGYDLALSFEFQLLFKLENFVIDTLIFISLTTVKLLT